MQVPVTGKRANALRRELSATVSERCAAPAELVWEVLADLRTHAQWGGDRQRETTRILSIVAPEGPAHVGVEFETTGTDPMGRFTDRSVVTEARRPVAFEFVTEARLETTKGATIDWTLVHRYVLRADGPACSIDYTVRVTRISELVGMLKVFGIPILSRLAMKASGSVARRGVRNLARMAEERNEAAVPRGKGARS
jgi:uncharacterized protein YndB with AHSA1/START domain